jgi:tripartite-type tricarboxylate transporter receptor subunit TctC
MRSALASTTACVAGGVALALAVFNAESAVGQGSVYPEKPIRFVVGQAPGGATDVVARLVASKMTELLGQHIVVENRTGAAGSIAAATVAKSPPDGYTILVVSSSYSINPSLYSHLPFDPQKDLVAVSLLADAPFLLVVHPSVPVKSVKDLIAIAKAKPGLFTYGSGGNGSSGHLAGALFGSLAGLKLTHVPYKGTGPALIDVIAGQISFMFASVLSSLPHVKQQQLHVLAVTSAKRSSVLPQVPTVAEAGVPGYSTTTWYGLLVPAGTRAEIVGQLSDAANKAVTAPELRDQLLGDGAEPYGGLPAVFQKHLAAEMVKWRQLVKSVGIAVE